jgi:SPP1 gp7 family putative phage head morphogenesis protein
VTILEAVETALLQELRGEAPDTRGMVRVTPDPVDPSRNAPGRRKDATGEDAFSIFDELLPHEITAFVDRAMSATQRSVDRKLRRVPAIDRSKLEIPLATDEIRARTTNLIRGTGRNHIKRLRKILLKGADLHVKDLVAQIQSATGVAKSKAELWARDQTLKMNGEVTRKRHEAAGIEEYIWTDSGDERVRDAHGDLNGNRYRYDNPPIISDDGRRGHPGDDYQCRCTAYPVTPGDNA